MIIYTIFRGTCPSINPTSEWDSEWVGQNKIWNSTILIYVFLNSGFVLDAKGQNSKAKPSIIKIEAQSNFWKIINFDKNLLKLKIPDLEIKFFILKGHQN